MAAEPIHGCSTMPMGMKTPEQGKGDTHATAQRRRALLWAALCDVLLPGVAQKPLLPRNSSVPACLRNGQSRSWAGGSTKGTGLAHPPWPSQEGPRGFQEELQGSRESQGPSLQLLFTFRDLQSREHNKTKLFLKGSGSQ